jgi:hypothetical protein
MTAISAVLQQRFFDCMLEFDPSNRRYGLKKRQQQAKRTAAPIEQGGGSKLEIERQAAQLRQADQIARQQFVEFTQAKLHDQVADELFTKLNRFELVANNVFNLSQGFPQVLDTLAARAVTLSQLEKVIQPIDWLKEDLLKYVNQPNLRKNSTSGYIRELKPALGLVGIDTLQHIIPLMALKRCLPHSTDPFTAFKNNFWQYSVDIARAAQRLALETGEHPFMAYCAGLFQSLGYFVVARTYLHTYKQIKQQALYDARDARDQELTDALDSLDADASFLTSCLLEFAPFMTADLMSNWKMRMLPLGSLMDQLAEGAEYSGASNLAQLIHQSACFVQCQWLYRAKQVNDLEVRQWFNEQKLRPELLAILKNTDSSTIEIG